MPRRLPPLATSFDEEVSRAEELVRRLEAARVALIKSPDAQNLLNVANLELFYEYAFLRVFLAWEYFLQETFVRFLCGYQHSSGQETIRGGGYYRNLPDAENAVLNGRDYVLWHNPNAVVRRAQRFFATGQHEQVLSSNLMRLEHFAAVRHRIAHSQRHARDQFDVTTMALCAKRYRGSRPGRFLRENNPMTNPPTKWLSIIAQELSGMAKQITP